MGNGSAVQNALAEVTGRRTVPNVFVAGSVSLKRRCDRGSMFSYRLARADVCYRERDDCARVFVA